MGVLKIKVNNTGDINTDWETIDNLKINTITSINSTDTNTSIKIEDGKLLINNNNLADYLAENTSACKVGGTAEPTGTGKTGDLYVQITAEGYSLLWYYNGSKWVRMNSIWG